MAEKIEMGKQYRTISGSPVTLNYVDEFFAFGYVDVTFAGIWCTKDGRAIPQLQDRGDLIEVKPKITRTYWLVHKVGFADDGNGITFPTEDRARSFAREYKARRESESQRPLAVTGPHTVEFEEGQGL